ncbi:MAG: ABC transporter ATP-binding protein [bacterium]
MTAIEVTNLKKRFGKVKAVDGISFTVNKGEVFGFLGPNGAGKTTAIRCMMDFLRPTEGEIKMLGLDSRRNSVELKEKTGYLAGTVRLYDKWTGEEHFDFVRKIDGDGDIAKDLASRLVFNPKKKTKELSSGNKQKLAVILAFMRKPELFILDEPTLALDPLLQNEVYEMLREAVSRGATVFMSSHNMAEVERVCDRVGIIKAGKMVATERIDTLKEKQIYRVVVRFTKKPDQKTFTNEQVKVIKETSDGFVLEVTGDINLIINKLQQNPVHDMTIEHATLDEIFRQYYQQ